uniref:cysteine dioxygenase n=1 Tax=Oryza sativa subsp. japonica TaxID=39947 RepID=Q5Z8U2_ORYSJ|nr:HGWP repeat containing protein-like [Oryza sativa Japonica Group]BAD53812.1 HGWP repeat containing protein-like [Oryza sativa Japonica Group]
MALSLSPTLQEWISQNITIGLPSPPPTGVSACTAGLLCRRLLGVYVFTDRLAFAAADWCLRLHGWPIMPPLLGVYVFTDRPPRLPPTGVSACTAGLLCRRCWASTSSPTGRLVCRRLVSPSARLAYYAAVVGRLRLHRPAASSTTDWCLRLHGWPIMPSLLGVYVFTDRPPRLPSAGVSACTAGLLCCRCWASTSSPTGHLPPTGVSACTAGLLCRRCWVSTSSPTGRLVCRRLVSPPARLAYYAAVVGRLYLHRPAASYDANCHDVYKSLGISVCVTKYDAVSFYYYKWFYNFQDSYSDILNTYLYSSNDYSMTRSYSSRLYVQLLSN